ncbi:hypothetical protein [Helicobacter pylori]|uniref:hypothetical protein n=1 Tax=Helicobacter pylori TaxID=210 RepID=UPI00026A0AB8|nr:hypothetical protein [Helicobacter pylori]EJB54679.1 hypothetical protein HPHPH28_1135 [Helicobacter pylori Hp H-28]
MIGAIKTLRELETKPTLSNHYGDGINYSVSNLNGNILPLLTECHNKERFKQQTK